MEAENNITKQMKEAARNAESKPFPGMENVWDKVTARLDEEMPEKKAVPFRPYKKMVAAAAVLILIGLGTGYLLAPKNNGITIAVNNYPAPAKVAKPLEKINNERLNNDKAAPASQEGMVAMINKKEEKKHLAGKASHNIVINADAAEKENNTVAVADKITFESIAPLPVSVVKGTIVDENGEGVVGAYVKVKGTNMATQTDVDGNYEIQIKTPQPIIEINSLGYEPKEISIAGSYTLGKIQLAPSKDVLAETITYDEPTIANSKYYGGAGATKSKQIENTPVTDVTKSIRGVSPGMQIPNGNDAVVGINGNSSGLNNYDAVYQNTGNTTTGNSFSAQNSGITNKYGSSNTSVKSTLQSTDNDQAAAVNNKPFSNAYNAIDGTTARSGASLQPRGKGSLSSYEKPMYVIDGVPCEVDINAINSADIASITILKGSMATSLYGARGKNGVVVIVTKSGQSNAGKRTKLDATSKSADSTISMPEKEALIKDK